MTAAIWMITYDLDPAHADEYLQWFDEVHIPEKLARPGYTWAAHYRVMAEEINGGSSYVALFGGTDSSVFYNPSPAQIKPTQSPETRSMMAHRSNSWMAILAEEWAFDMSSASNADEVPENSAIGSDVINLAWFDGGDNDQDLGTWLIQDYLPATTSDVVRKYLASTGAARHVLIEEQCAGSGKSGSFFDVAVSELSWPAGDPVQASRVWPSIDNCK